MCCFNKVNLSAILMVYKRITRYINLVLWQHVVCCVRVVWCSVETGCQCACCAVQRDIQALMLLTILVTPIKQLCSLQFLLSVKYFSIHQTPILRHQL